MHRPYSGTASVPPERVVRTHTQHRYGCIHGGRVGSFGSDEQLSLSAPPLRLEVMKLFLPGPVPLIQAQP